MSKKIFYILVGFLLLNIFIPGSVISDDKQLVDRDNFSLIDYKEKASVGEKHFLKIGMRSSYSPDDIGYNIVGSSKDIKIFNQCVDVDLVVYKDHFRIIGNVTRFGVYHVDIQPVVKGISLHGVNGIGSWWNSSWSYYRVLTVDPNQVPSNQNDIPVLVPINISTYQKTDNLSSIRFVMPNNKTELKYQLDFHSDSGYSYFWVKVNLNSSFQMLMYYNNSDAVFNCSNDVWNSNYKYVTHVNDSDNMLSDATSNGNHFKEVGDPSYQQDGVVGYSWGGDGSSDWFVNTSTLAISSFDYLTVEVWYKNNGFDANEKDYLFHSRFDATINDLRFAYRDGATGNNDCGGDYTIDDGVNDGGNDYTHDSLTTWHYYVLSTDTSTVYGYLNSSLVVEDPADVALNLADDLHAIGARAYAVSKQPMDGWMDEIRISNACLSDDWISISFNTVFNATTVTPFWNWGTEITQEEEQEEEAVPISFTVLTGNNTNSCPCCISLCYNVSTVGSSNVTLNSNYTGSWLPLQSFTHGRNGSYCFVVYNWTRYNFTYWFNYTYNNGVNFSYTSYYYVKTDTYNRCINMEIELSINLLGLLFAILVFYIAFKIDERNNIWKPILLFLDVPICLAVGVVYLGNNVNSIGWWIGIFMFGFAIILSFGGLYYSMIFGRRA